MTHEHLADIVHGFAQTRVLVVGDVILDRYVTGEAGRLSPEAPIPVLRPTARRASLGGAANVAVNIARLGGQPGLVGLIGSDPAGAEIEALLGGESSVRARMVTAPARPTTAKTRFMAGAHQLLRLDEETTGPLDAPAAAALLDAFEAALAQADVVVLSDYAKGVLGGALLGEVLARCAGQGRIVIADPKRAEFASYRGATILTPNETEARLATRIDGADDAGAEQAGRAALEAFGGEAVVLTRSARGLTLVQADTPALHLPARAHEVSDVSGAGDTLVATLALALAAGAPLVEAAQLANITAGISVGKPGTATVGREELLGVLHVRELLATDRKVATRAQAVARVAAWRAQGLRIGFTNGCFDLIHPGHVRLLTEARAACDRLVVALNTDASVARLKGPSRPAQGETARATVMASLAPVDLVVLFGEDTPSDLIRALRPEVLVKGADYTIDRVVGADLVTGWGGKVLLVELREGHSTSGTIRRMTERSAMGND